MTREIFASFTLEGFHRWPDATSPTSFLAARHRHLFHVRAWAPVTGEDREVEFILLGRSLRAELFALYGDPAELGSMSCEALARQLLDRRPELSAVEVSEDGENGARVTR